MDKNTTSCVSCAHSFSFTISTHQSLSFHRCTRLLHCRPVPIVLSHSLDHLLSCSRSFIVGSELRECVKPSAAGLSASHSCVTSAASQPSTTGRDALRPGDLRARCVVTSAVSATLTSRLSHIAPKYRAASPNLHGFFDLWIFMVLLSPREKRLFFK